MFTTIPMYLLASPGPVFPSVKARRVPNPSAAKDLLRESSYVIISSRPVCHRSKHKRKLMVSKSRVSPFSTSKVFLVPSQEKLADHLESLLVADNCDITVFFRNI